MSGSGEIFSSTPDAADDAIGCLVEFGNGLVREYGPPILTAIDKAVAEMTELPEDRQLVDAVNEIVY